jgi:hypothetical protein
MFTTDVCFDVQSMRTVCEQTVSSAFLRVVRAWPYGSPRQEVRQQHTEPGTGPSSPSSMTANLQELH